MPEDKFDNEYDVIIFALSTILDQLERQDQLFAAQCIWWLASIIQYMEILLFYRQYQIFPSYYVKNCIVTPLPAVNKEVQPEEEIPALDLAEGIIEESERQSLQGDLATPQTVLGSMRSRRVFKPQKLKQKELKQQYPGRSIKQLQMIRDSLRKDGLILYVKIQG